MQGVIYTLLLGLLSIWIWDRAPVPVWVKLAGIGGLLWLSRWGDWMYFDVLWPLCLFIFRNQPRRKWLSYWLIALSVVIAMNWDMFRYPRYWWRSLFQLGVLMAPVLMQFVYNGEPGSRKPFHKWFFYVFYPAHMLVLAAIRYHWWTLLS